MLRNFKRFRSSRLQVFLGKSVLKVCSKLWYATFNNVTLQLCWNRTSAWVFSCKFAAYFQNTFFSEHIWMAASADSFTIFIIKKRLRYRCFPVKFAKFLRTPFFTEYLRWLLLMFLSSVESECPTAARVFKCPLSAQMSNECSSSKKGL